MPKNWGQGKNGNAVAQCMRSGIKMRLSDMVQDGYYPGLMVHPDWYEPPEPQEQFLSVVDDAAVDNPSPENYRIATEVNFPTYDSDFNLNKVFELTLELGTLTVSITPSAFGTSADSQQSSIGLFNVVYDVAGLSTTAGDTPQGVLGGFVNILDVSLIS